MGICNVTTEQKLAFKEKMSDMWDYWLDRPNISKRFEDKFQGYDGDASRRSMEWLIEQQLELPWSENFVLSKEQLARAKVEIDSFDKALGGKFANFAFVVPEGISKQDPVARRFYLQLNSILNHERVNTNTILTKNALIANHMLKAYTSMHGGKNDNAIKRLKELRNDMIKAESEGISEQHFINEMERFIEKDKEGKTIKELIELMEMPKDEFLKVPKDSYRNSEGKKIVYNSHVYNAAKEARNLSNFLGNTYIKGLEAIQRIGALKFTNTSILKEARMRSSQADNFITKVQETIDYLKQVNETEGYFPHVTFETMLNLKTKLSEALGVDKLQRDLVFSDVANNILNQIDLGSLPGHAKGRNSSLKKFYDKDPMMVLKEYGDQATQFNKLIHTQLNYLDALKNIPKSDESFISGLKNFITEEYAVFTKGTGERPDFINKAVTTLNALQTARTMGLNITGAIKNAASAIHYYSRVGFTSLRDSVKAYNHDNTFKIMIDKAEREAGFLFTDVATELYTEGLITKDQLESQVISFNAKTGKITVNERPLLGILKKSGKWTLDKALFFHRLTENNQRKWMFRTSFHQKYFQLIDAGYNSNKSRMFAQNHALKMVNGWAYEYAAHAKSKAVRGEWRTIDQMEDGTPIQRKLSGTLGGLSEVTFHLLHYPMSLMESQYSSLKGAYKAALAKQWDAEEIHYVMRYAGASTLISLASALLNTDLSNILENESQERVTRIIDDLTQYNNPDRSTFGLLSEFTGPTIGTLKYMATAQNLIDIEHSDLNKILFGNVDFGDDTDLDARRYSAYQWSTEWGVVKNKLWPALKAGRGRDIMMHWLKMYPSKTTKDRHEFIFGKQSKKKTSKNTSAALKILEDMRRGL